jgi:oxygen-dependent protoporphyrinogen oxidase
MGGTFDPGVMAAMDEAIIARATAEVRTITGLDQAPDLAAVWRHPNAIPQYQVGHGALVETVESGLREVPGLHLLGTALRGVGVNDCIRNATALARTLTGPSASGSP